MSRITQLEDDIKSGSKSREEYENQLNHIKGYLSSQNSRDGKAFLDALDSTAEIIDTLFIRYRINSK